MSESVDPSLSADWQFHQATGMLAAQLGTHDMAAAAARLLLLAEERRESARDIVRAVIERRLRV